MDFQLLQIDRVTWLWLVAAATLAIAWGLWSRRARLQRLMEHGLAERLASGPSLLRMVVRATLVLGSLIALAVAFMDPRWGFEFREARRRGIDIVFVVDCSRSMLAEDVSPNRLGRAKEYVLETLDRLGGERVSLVAFAGVGSVRCPLTLNYGAMRAAIDGLEPMEGGRGGSLLGVGLETAADAFVDEGPQSKVVILLTDGDDQDSAPMDVIKELNQQNVRLYVVGLGDTVDGARIPIVRDGQRVYLTHEGREVWTKMSPDALRPLAEATQGVFLPAATRRIDLGEFYVQRIAELSDAELEQESVREAIPRFQWFVGAALVLLLIEGLMADRTLPRGGRTVDEGQFA